MDGVTNAIESRLIWVVGSSRSGSTWLTRMLAAHDGVLRIDDPHIGHHLSVWRPISLAWGTATRLPELRTLGEVKGHHDDYFFSDRYRDAWEPALREMILTRFAAQAEDLAQDGGVRDPLIAVKDPGAAGVAELVSELFPRSRLLYIMRDGRDVVDSWLDAYRKGAWGMDEGTYSLAPEGRLAFVRWQASVWLYRTEACQRAFERHDPGRRVQVRYEELRADPVRELARVCLKLGISTSLERVRQIVAELSYDEVPKASRGPGRRIRSAQPGAWRRNLSAEERAAMSQIMGPKLRELGYEPRRRFRKTA
jgi:Sulfotransferase family